MKNIVIGLVLLSSIIRGQDYKLVDQGNSNKVMLVGISPIEVYQDSNFSNWFNSEYTQYNVNTKLLSAHQNKFEGKVVKIVLGTWCVDSRREVPRFVKVLDFLQFPKDKILFINVDREKKGLTDEAEGLDIEFVPTFILFENGNELGRIIETPINSLEEDLVDIVN